MDVLYCLKHNAIHADLTLHTPFIGRHTFEVEKPRYAGPKRRSLRRVARFPRVGCLGRQTDIACPRETHVVFLHVLPTWP